MNYVEISGKDNLILPNNGDAGADLVAAGDPVFVDGFSGDGDYIEYDTGVKLAPSDSNVHAIIVPRSSISKTNLILCNVPLIDNSYRGNIKLRFRYFPSSSDFYAGENGQISIRINPLKIYQKGDKIAQLLFFKSSHPELVDAEIKNNTARGKGGFGSTGK